MHATAKWNVLVCWLFADLIDFFLQMLAIGADVLSIAKTQNREENNAQEYQGYSKAGVFSKRFCQCNHDHKNDVDVGDWDKDQPPVFNATDFGHDVIIVKGNQTGPAGLAGFFKYPPDGSDNQEKNTEIENDDK